MDLDLPRRNGHYFALFHRISVAFGADYVKVIEDRPIYCLRQKCSSKNLVFSDIIYGDIRRGYRERVLYYLCGHTLWVTDSHFVIDLFISQ